MVKVAPAAGRGDDGTDRAIPRFAGQVDDHLGVVEQRRDRRRGRDARERTVVRTAATTEPRAVGRDRQRGDEHHVDGSDGIDAERLVTRQRDPVEIVVGLGDRHQHPDAAPHQFVQQLARAGLGTQRQIRSYRRPPCLGLTSEHRVADGSARRSIWAGA